MCLAWLLKHLCVFCVVHLNASTCVFCPVGHLWDSWACRASHTAWELGASHWNALALASTLSCTLKHTTASSYCTKSYFGLDGSSSNAVFQIALNWLKHSVKCGAAVRHCYGLLACSASGFWQNLPKKRIQGFAVVSVFQISHFNICHSWSKANMCDLRLII